MCTLNWVLVFDQPNGCSLQSYDFIELWAGQAMASTMVRKSGRDVAALDINYYQPDPEHPKRSNHFDVLTNSGFMFLGYLYQLSLYSWIILCWYEFLKIKFSMYKAICLALY